MKNQGTDGLSRGDKTTGVMAGDDFLSHVPLNKGAFARHEPLKKWLMEALPGKGWEVLDEDGWFQKAYKNPGGKFIWAPAPCVAHICMEQMCEVRYIHPDLSHVLYVQR